ncbi:MAG: RNase adapter RapZ [Oscillospiraceae bacterium]|jgi:UPF0042 nucleotide-binding protein|nr:RNase adapter RapZ [Oscillospiraceae bacterium]
MRLLIVTGMSGAGKSIVTDALEDMGWFCADNLPPSLAPTFVRLLESAAEPVEDCAIVMDARAGSSFEEAALILDGMRTEGTVFSVLFLDAPDEVLERRYKETRRQHPLLARQPSLGLSGAIAAERKLMEPLRARADYYLDTGNLRPSECKERMAELFAAGTQGVMQIHLNSFGFKNGAPHDADMIFDVRCLPNPFYIAELKAHTGLEKCIEDFVFSFPESREMYNRIQDLLLFSLPLHKKEGKSSLTISFGCTGGKHRSVLFTRLLGEKLKEDGWPVHVSHRDIDKGVHGRQ